MARHLGAFFLLAVSVLASRTVTADEALDTSFASWVSKEPRPTFGAIATRFISAAGRDAGQYQATMETLAREFRAFLKLKGEPGGARERVQLLREFFFKEQRFAADLDLSLPENLYPDAIVARRKGYCLGLTVVLLDLGERIGWPLVPGAAPRHIFVRYEPSGAKVSAPLNIETTRGGEIHDDGWYADHFGLETRSLTPAETAAHLINNHGFVLLGQGRTGAAEREFRAALKIAPQLVEACINLGVLQARARDFETCLRTFEEALKQWPDDVDLRMNRVNALLSLERIVDAARELEPLVPSHGDLERLGRTVRAVRSQLDRHRHWKRIQSLSTGLNARLSAASGKQPGLRGTYFKDARLRSRSFERVDRDIAFKWNWGSPGRSVPKDHFSVRWEGWIDIPVADAYNFWIVLSDGVRVWIDGHEVVDAWRRANDNSVDLDLRLEAGLHDIRIEYFESIGEAGIKIFMTADKQEEILDLSRYLCHGKR